MTNQAPDRIVILGSGITALAVARCARRLGLQPVIFDTTAQIATHSRLVRTEIHPEPWCDSILERLQKLGDRKRAFLIATADAWLQFLILHRAQLEEAFQRILHPGNEALSLCLDKGRFADWCELHGVRSPKRYRLRDQMHTENNDLEFPLLVRPAETLHTAPDFASLKAVEVHSHAALAEQLQKLIRANREPVLSQSLLGRSLVQHSVGFARHGGHMITVVARKVRPRPEACAPGTLVETRSDARLDSMALQVARLLDYEGIGELEVLEDAGTGELFLIEINPRPWLQFALGAATGRDLLGLVTRDQPVCAGMSAQQSARWLDFRADLRCSLPALRTGQLKLGDYLRSIASANVHALWAASDQRPFWQGIAELVRRAIRPDASGRETARAAGSHAARPRRSLRPQAGDSKSWSGWG